MTLIDIILNKTENNSKSDWREGASGNRSFPVGEKELKQLGNQQFINEAKQLESEGLIRCKWYAVNSILERVSYSLSDLPIFYERTGRIPKSLRITEMSEAVKMQLKQTEKAWIKAYYDHFLQQLEKGKEPEALTEGKREGLFACFAGLDSLKESVYKRIFSKQYLKDSKAFEMEYQSEVIAAAKKHYDMIDEDMTHTEILSQIFIEEYRVELDLKGNLNLKLEGRNIDLSAFVYGAVLNNETLKKVRILQDQNISKVITVENKANYMTYPYEEGTLVIFSHGYFSPMERQFLIDLRAKLGSETEYYHSGDLDYGGIRIFLYEKNRIFPELKPLDMSVDLWRKYRNHTYLMEDSKVEKLRNMVESGQLEGTGLKELAEVLADTKQAIEQESFLFIE